jgi:hypothetical protein
MRLELPGMCRRRQRPLRKAGLSWAEIATALGVTRQAAWERWHEIDETLPKSDAWGPFSLNDAVPERWAGLRQKAGKSAAAGAAACSGGCSPLDL